MPWHFGLKMLLKEEEQLLFNFLSLLGRKTLVTRVQPWLQLPILKKVVVKQRRDIF